MKCQYVEDRFIALEHNLDKAKEVAHVDPELASMLSSYLVVIISGIYEDCIEYLFTERAGKSKDEEIKSLVKHFFKTYFRNPEYGRIKDFVKVLNPEHAKRMDSEIDEKSRVGMKSIYDNRIQVAHYGNPANATINDVSDFHAGSRKVFDFLEKILL